MGNETIIEQFLNTYPHVYKAVEDVLFREALLRFLVSAVLVLTIICAYVACLHVVGRMAVKLGLGFFMISCIAYFSFDTKNNAFDMYKISAGSSKELVYKYIEDDILFLKKGD